MKRTLIIDPPGPFSPREELEEFIREAKQLEDAHLEPVKSAIELAEEELKLKEND